MPKLSYEWFNTQSGKTFWGPQGAAGILFYHPPTNTYLLGHRSPYVHHGDTWGIPGGALDPGETPYQAALREAEEEFGGVPKHTVVKEHEFKPDPEWSYHTFVAHVPERFDPEYEGDWETQGHGWFTPEEMAQLPLHPGFASTWNSGALTKESKYGFFYHTAPRKYREQIEREGLQPTLETPESPWAGEKWRDEMVEPQPSGVYLWDDPRHAKGYAALLQQRSGFPYPGDEEDYEPYYETPAYEEYQQAYPGERDEYDDPVDYDDYDDYMTGYEHKPEPLYDVWKVNTTGMEPQIDPEEALLHGGWQSPEEAQRGINEEYARHNEVGKTEGHRWYLPHSIDPSRLMLHDHVYPSELTQEAAENHEPPEDRMIPNQWSRVPFNEWNENARRRYLGDPQVMREIDPQDRTSQWHEPESRWIEVTPH